MRKALFNFIFPFLLSGGVFAQDMVAAPLSLFPVELAKDLKIPNEAKSLRLKIVSGEPKSFISTLPKGIKAQLLKDGLELTINKSYIPTDKSRPGKELLESSFVIDYQEPIMVALLGELKTTYKETSLFNVERFVNLYINKKNSSDFLPASVVAIRKAGDCKGHAVLTSAFLRQLKLPSRVVLGIVISQVGEKFIVAGHAWSEVFINGKWEHADAAQILYKPRSFYLPLSQIKDESASFQMGLGQNTLPTFEKIIVESVL